MRGFSAGHGEKKARKLVVYVDPPEWVEDDGETQKGPGPGHDRKVN
jgi:hypothetical protein